MVHMASGQWSSGWSGVVVDDEDDDDAWCQIAICSWLLDTLLPCFALFAGVPKRQMNLGLGRENFTVIVKHVLFHTDMVHDNYFYAGGSTMILMMMMSTTRPISPASLAGSS
jgi:hypothetical protein